MLAVTVTIMVSAALNHWLVVSFSWYLSTVFYYWFPPELAHGVWEEFDYAFTCTGLVVLLDFSFSLPGKESKSTEAIVEL
jgi:hypothetical protein